MMHVRGNRRDFDAWAELGNKGWSYEEVLPYFKKSETYHGPISPYHGDNGPLSIIDIRRSPAGVARIRRGGTLNWAPRRSTTTSTEPRRKRARASIRRPGPSMASALPRRPPSSSRSWSARISGCCRRCGSTRLLIEKGRAVGVEYAGPDGRQTIWAEREVLVCCGAFETPKLLMLSGLGPAEQLAAHDIPVVQDLPGVGGNLHDHLLLSIAFESLSDLPAARAGGRSRAFHVDRSRESPEVAEPAVLLRARPPALPPVVRTGAGPNRAFTFTPILNQPLSRGTVTLASRDPAALARVDPQYLARDEDLAVLEFGIRYARELVHTQRIRRAARTGDRSRSSGHQQQGAPRLRS